MKTRVLKKILGILCLASFPLLAQTVSSPAATFIEDTYDVSLTPQTQEHQYKEVLLTKELYPYIAEDYGNLRIYSLDNTTEIPYILHKCEDTLYEKQNTYDMQLINMYALDEDKYYDYKIIDSKDSTENVLISSLKFKLPTNKAAKEVEVLGSYNGTIWELVQKDSLYFIDNHKQKKEIIFSNPQKYPYYRIAVLKYANELDLTAVTAHYNESAIIANTFTEKLSPDYTQVQESSETILTIYNPYNLNTSSLEVKFKGNYNRNYVIELYTDNDKLIQTLNGEIYNLDFETAQAYNGTVLTNVFKDYAYAKLIIENNDSQALELDSIQHTYYLDQLIFEPTTEDYKLVLFPKDTKAPTYDMANYQELVGSEEKDKVLADTTVTFQAGTPLEEELENKSFEYDELYLIGTLLCILMLLDNKRKQLKE